MKFHIVSIGESLKKIAFLYNLEEEELKKENKHIRIWDRLVPGTKLKIPTISETIDHEIANMEPFIEDYYPKLKIDNMPNLDSIKKPEHQTFKAENKTSNQENYEQPKEMPIIEENKQEDVIEDNLQMIPTNSKQEIKTFTPSTNNEEVVKDVAPMIIPQGTIPEYRPPYYAYPVYYQYPRYVYPTYYYPVYYYPVKPN